MSSLDLNRNLSGPEGSTIYPGLLFLKSSYILHPPPTNELKEVASDFFHKLALLQEGTRCQFSLSPAPIYLPPHTLYECLQLTQGHCCAHVSPSTYTRPTLSSHSAQACPHTKYIHRPYQQHHMGLRLVSSRRFGPSPTNSILNKTKSKTLATVISSTHHQKLPASLKSKRASGEVLKPVGGF